MKKVCILVDDYGFGLENKINNFLENHAVTDIQYQVAANYTGFGYREIHSAMLVYEEET